MAAESFDQQQKRLKAEFEYKQNEITKAEERLYDQSGSRLKDWAQTRDPDLSSDPEKQEAVAKAMAHVLAERGVKTGDLSLVDLKDFRDVPDQAIKNVEEREQNPEPPAPDHEPPRSELIRQPEGTPERQQPGDPDRVLERAYGALKIENAQGEGHQRPDPSANPEPVRTYADLKHEHAAIVGSNAPGNENSGGKKLEFFGAGEKEQLEHSGEDRGHDRNNDREKGDGQQRELEFFEDKHPGKDHGMEH